jgi:UDP-N-acetylglucosamine 2-epimerase (non-hydrolysing)/GDP/UDP-N,N'-diacetylbacillosamine 2-epimerase (hydrolysing)
MHLAPEFGLTYRQIEQDGFSIDEKVEMLLASDTPVGVGSAMGLGTIGFAGAFDRIKPDLLLVLGDRFEILAAAQAALVARIPIAHLAGGDTTEGAFDEAIRHSLTKMAHLHFVTNSQAARRVRQLGENPAHIYNVGSTGLDQIRNLSLMSRVELEASLGGFKFRPRNLLITFHPATLDDQDPVEQMQELFIALDRLGSDVGLIFTLPNADTGGRALISMVERFCAERSHSQAYASLGHLRYLSAMAHVDVIVGNSSSGLYEAPSFCKPTVNIGDRQAGRLRAASVLDCAPHADAIETAIVQAFTRDCSGVTNPYGDGLSSERIIKVLRDLDCPRSLLKKRFFMLEDDHG